MRKTPRSPRRRKTRDAVRIMDAMVGKNAKLRRRADDAVENALVGQAIYRARTGAGLTQQQLADLIGTGQSAISRLEDADYEGYSLTILRRIAGALGKRLEIRFVDAA